MATNIGPKIGIDGEAQYRKQINNIIQQANTLASEMKAVTASFDENTTAQEQAAAKGTVLAKQIEVQEQRIAALNEMLGKSSAKYGEADTKTLKWQQSVNEATAVLMKMEREQEELNRVLSETEAPELDFDEGSVKKALSAIEQEARTLASEMKLLSAEFDDTASAQERAAAKAKVLAQQVENQRSRVDALSDAVEKSTAAYGENDSETLKWRQSLNEAKTELIKLQRELRDTERELEDVGDAANDAASPIRRAGNAMDDAAGGAFTLGKALTAGGIIEGGKAIIGVLVDLIERTEEYRRIMASLEVSSGRAGYTAEETAEGFDLLYGVLGDDQSSATALANLQALGASQSDLKLLINGTVGAWSAYGDSIPIDGLAEAINETVQVGKVTGTFADVLNWAGRSEDDFNAKLEACADSSERVELILQELADQGLVDLGAAWQENNKDIVANNNATNDLNRAYARFATLAAPAVNSALQTVADGLNNTLDWWEANDEAVKTFIGDMNAAEEATVESTQVMNAALADYAAEVEAAMVASQQATADNAMAQNEAFAEIAAGLRSMVGNMISANTQAQLSTAQMSLNVGQSFWEMQQNAGEAVLQFALDIESGVNNAVDYLEGLADDAREWGRDWIQEFIDGALAKLPTLEEAAADVAAVIRKYLHFTVPDVGPLSDADEYGPDFIKLLSGGIRGHLPELENAVNMAAESMVIQPHVIAAPQGGSVNTVNRIDGFTVNVYAAEGQSPQDVAEAVKDMIYAEVTRKEAVFGA